MTMHENEALNNTPNNDKRWESVKHVPFRSNVSHLRPKNYNLEYRKVGGALGSTDGGWYMHSSGEKLYTKFYDNPDQGRVEYVANAIYKKLGIRAVDSRIISIGGHEAVASPALSYPKYVSKDTLKTNSDVQDGFVADAFLANWDSVGASYDNIVQCEDGLYRVDSGGSLIFRATGSTKDYPSDSIPELRTMRDPKYHAGEVFANITDDEVSRQARVLVEKLSPDDIQSIVERSGLKAKERNAVLTGLLGRREYLLKRYGGVANAIKMVTQQEIRNHAGVFSNPRTEVFCGGDSIEDHRIDVIGRKVLNRVELKLKLRCDWDEVLSFFSSAINQGTIMRSGATLKRGAIIYEQEAASPKHEQLHENVNSNPLSSRRSPIVRKSPLLFLFGKKQICDAYILEKNNIRICIADPKSLHGRPLDDGASILSAKGLVKIEAPFDADPEVIQKTLSEVLQNDLEINNPLGEVSENTEKDYKRIRYGWQHVIKSLTLEQSKCADNMKYKEVFPGYSTFVEEDKHEEYLKKYGMDLRAVHQLGAINAKSIYELLTKGLMCTTERLFRGIFVEGMSSSLDIETGGADSVFTRVTNEKQRREIKGAIVILKPEVFNRTDWYSYTDDHCGCTAAEIMATRLSPDDLFSAVLNSKIRKSNNEQMFRTGIGAEYIEAIEIAPALYHGLVQELKLMGLSTVGERPIETIVRRRAI